jgi:hypothetical protein
MEGCTGSAQQPCSAEPVQTFNFYGQCAIRYCASAIMIAAATGPRLYPIAPVAGCYPVICAAV